MIALFILAVLMGVFAYYRGKIHAKKELEIEVAKCSAEIIKKYEEWKVQFTRDFQQSFMGTANQVAIREAEVQLAEWKAAYTAKQRADAVKKSVSINRGMMAEQLAPFMEGFTYNPKDAHFIGQPVDYLIFDGLQDGEIKEIILMEVKTGKSYNNTRETQVKRAIKEGRVRYETFRPDHVESQVQADYIEPGPKTRTEVQGCTIVESS